MEGTMSSEELLKIIADNYLCIRRLPFEVISYRDYQEGDEHKKYVDSKGNLIDRKREVVIQDFDLEYFQKKTPPKWETRTPEKRYEEWKKKFPNGKKLLKETRVIEKGGWWYVKEVKNTDSTITFSREYDKFFAPTLEEAVKLYLKSKI